MNSENKTFSITKLKEINLNYKICVIYIIENIDYLIDIKEEC